MQHDCYFTPRRKKYLFGTKDINKKEKKHANITNNTEI